MLGWAGLIVYVVGFDFWAWRRGSKTLSASFEDAQGSLGGRWWTIVVWVYLTVHLHRVLPKRFDPLRAWL